MISFYFREHLRSSDIRARQLAPRLGARLNPPDARNADTCVCLKDTPARFGRHRGVWLDGPLVLDVLDNTHAIPQARKYGSRLRLLAASRPGAAYLRQRCPENPVTYLPQQHCNAANEMRTRATVTTVAMLGVEQVPAVLQRQAAVWGLTIVPDGLFVPSVRHEDVVAFYRQIDVQIVWRTWLADWPELMQLKNALCVANAASFGIPTIAWPEPAFVEEFGGAFLPAQTLEEVAAQLNVLRDPAGYQHWSEAALTRAAAYHVDRIIALYRQLEEAA